MSRFSSEICLKHVRVAKHHWPCTFPISEPTAQKGKRRKVNISLVPRISNTHTYPHCLGLTFTFCTLNKRAVQMWVQEREGLGKKARMSLSVWSSRRSDNGIGREGRRQRRVKEQGVMKTFESVYSQWLTSSERIVCRITLICSPLRLGRPTSIFSLLFSILSYCKVVIFANWKATTVKKIDHLIDHLPITSFFMRLIMLY